MNGHAYQEMKPGKDEQRRAPPPGVGQRMRERPENGTGKAAEESQARDGATIAVRRDPIEAREGWIVETCCHRQPSEHPTRREHDRLAGYSDYNECKRRSERAQRHHVPPTGSIDPPANRRSCHAREKLPQREGAEDHEVIEPQLLPDRRGEHRQGVVERAPADDLCDAQQRNRSPKRSRTIVIVCAIGHRRRIIGLDWE